MVRPRVLLADEHRLVREALANLLGRSCDLVGLVATGRELLASAPNLRPDVVVLDLDMPLLNGLDAIRQLRLQLPRVNIIVLTVSEDSDLAAEAIHAGAAGYLLKDSAASELLQAIRDVYEGGTYITPLADPSLRDSFEHNSEASREKLEASPRQREILQLLAEGHTMKEVGQVLNITARTVAFHKYTMMKHLGIKSSAKLVQYAVKQHLVY